MDWRWIVPVFVVAALVGGFMALDKTTLHWYVPDEDDLVASARINLTPTATPVTPSPTPRPRITAGEAQSLALEWVSSTFGTLGGYECAEPELNEAESRWTSVCTERADENPEIVVVSVHTMSGLAEELVVQ